MLLVLRIFLGIVAFILWTQVGVRAAEEPIPPPPAHWATDTAHVLSAQTLYRLDERLRAFEAETRHQVLLYVTSTTGETPTEEWTAHAFKKWRVGRMGLDDGLVLFVITRDRKVRIEVGYGLEGVVPDVVAARIIRQGIIPWFRVGDFDRGATNGVTLLLQQIGGEGSGVAAQAPRPQQSTELTLPQKIVLFIMGFLFLVALSQNPWLALYLLAGIFSGRGGSFGGGGGRSGGGGASGSW